MKGVIASHRTTYLSDAVHAGSEYSLFVRLAAQRLRPTEVTDNHVVSMGGAARSRRVPVAS